MALLKSEILRKAELLASNLAGESVKKNAFLSVVSDFMTDMSPKINKLKGMLLLLKEGSGGHLKRGGGYGEQVRSVVHEVSHILDKDNLSSEDLKSIFGWTARLLQIRVGRADSVRERSYSILSNAKKREQESRASAKDSKAFQSFGGIGRGGLDVLERLREQIKRDKEGAEG